MTDRTHHYDDPTERAPGSSRITVWSGWIWFAAILMVLSGMFNAVEGLVALFNRSFYVSNGEHLVLLDLTTWGWLHLLIGGLVALAGIALLSGAVWARVVAVVLAVINAVAQMAFITAYPVWSTIVITLCIVVIWALVVHGNETGDLS